jgi:hypothetical protein
MPENRWHEEQDTDRCRLQKECQSRHDAGDDEDGYVEDRNWVGIRLNNAGHVEKTNDRDYEVEER